MELKELIESLKWQDISIILTEDNNPILILLCPNQQEADKLFLLITQNGFTLNVIEKENSQHELHLALDNTDYVIGFLTPKTLTSYPPLKFLHNKQITSITCGFYDETDTLRYNTKLHPLDSKQIFLN